MDEVAHNDYWQLIQSRKILEDIAVGAYSDVGVVPRGVKIDN